MKIVVTLDAGHTTQHIITVPSSEVAQSVMQRFINGMREARGR